jgi:hypothetical protein
MAAATISAEPLGHAGEHVSEEVDSTALPAGAGHDGGDGGLEAGVVVTPVAMTTTRETTRPFTLALR